MNSNSTNLKRHGEESAGKSIEIRLRGAGRLCSNSLWLLLNKTHLSGFVRCTDRPLLLSLRFCGLIFRTTPNGPKNGTVKVVFSIILPGCTCGSRNGVPFLGLY